MTQTQTWLEEMAKKRKHLYAKYGKPLEGKHSGKFIAISQNGKIIFGENMEAIAVEAYEKFGSNNFVLARIGHSETSSWPTAHSV